MPNRKGTLLPSQAAIESFLRERIAAAVAPRVHFSVGSVEDETLCLVRDGSEWVVGYGERGSFYPEARFESDMGAAKYLILLLLDRREGFPFPAIDWRGYADLPEA